MGRTKPLALYGLKNCDTVRKARAWLEACGAAYEFHDFKQEGAGRARLEAWAGEVGWEALLNRAGTTFRGLPEADRQGLDKAKALALMNAHPSLIKRPVLDLGGRILVGFKPALYAEALGATKA
jgi:Spx/MgsR family transcriptional regulator